MCVTIDYHHISYNMHDQRAQEWRNLLSRSSDHLQFLFETIQLQEVRLTNLHRSVCIMLDPDNLPRVCLEDEAKNYLNIMASLSAEDEKDLPTPSKLLGTANVCKEGVDRLVECLKETPRVEDRVLITVKHIHTYFGLLICEIGSIDKFIDSRIDALILLFNTFHRGVEFSYDHNNDRNGKHYTENLLVNFKRVLETLLLYARRKLITKSYLEETMDKLNKCAANNKPL